MAAAERIDVHFHFIPEFFQQAAYAAGTGPAMGRYPQWSPALALEMMDRHEIALGITSIAAPGVHFAAQDQARALARRCNDYAAELHAQWPRRFGAFATLPMHRMADAISEATYALDQLKFQGVCLFANYAGKFLGDPLFDPLMAALDEQSAVAFVHPALHPLTSQIDLPWPGFLMEYVFDTTRAAVNLLFSGALQRFPRIRFILAHAGGTMPYFAWRLSTAPMVSGSLPQLTPEQVFAGMRHFYYDNALSCGPTAMNALRTIADPERILYGSDWPFANDRVVQEEVKAHLAPRLHSEEQRAAIDRANALKLWPGLTA